MPNGKSCAVTTKGQDVLSSLSGDTAWSWLSLWSHVSFHHRQGGRSSCWHVGLEGTRTQSEPGGTFSISNIENIGQSEAQFPMSGRNGKWAQPDLHLLRARYSILDFNSCETMQGQFSKPFDFFLNPGVMPGIYPQLKLGAIILELRREFLAGDFLPVEEAAEQGTECGVCP